MFQAGFRSARAAAIGTLLLAVGSSVVNAQVAPRVHRLPATPSTVAYGYYWSEKAPALSIASGDIIDV